jgi:hypothetical protein
VFSPKALPSRVAASAGARFALAAPSSAERVGGVDDASGIDASGRCDKEPLGGGRYEKWYGG